MLSIGILRKFKNLRVHELIEQANISQQSYYNFLYGRKPISDKIIEALAEALDCPHLQSLHFLDRLYINGIKIGSIQFPSNMPEDIKNQILKDHPIFKDV